MTDDWTIRPAPSLEDIAAMARLAQANLPGPYRAAAAEVSLRIEDFAPEMILEEMAIDNPFGLTGLYDGIPMIEKSVMDQPHGPDTIWLFRRPILDEWADRGNVALGTLVAHVYVHELAHHFGWSDADIAAIDPWWE